MRAQFRKRIAGAVGGNLVVGKTPWPEEVAEGFIDIAVGNMSNAIKQISVQRGYDVTVVDPAATSRIGLCSS